MGSLAQALLMDVMTNIALRGLMLGWALTLIAGCSSDGACTDAGAAMDSF